MGGIIMILYSTGCPKCEVLKQKLKEKNILFDEITDVDIMIEKGMMFAPMLEIDGKELDFKEAVQFINQM